MNVAAEIAETGKMLVQIIVIKLTQEQLVKKDSGIMKNAATVKDYFAGYPYLVELQWRKDVRLEILYKEIFQWCEDSEITEFFHNILRVNKLNAGDDSNEYVIAAAGKDIWFWAFANEKDALMFSLRWK